MKCFSLAFALLVFASFSMVAETPEEHAKKIIIPKVDLRDATVPEAVEFLRKSAEKLDAGGKGLNIIYIGPAEVATPPPPQSGGGIPGLEIPAVPGSGKVPKLEQAVPVPPLTKPSAGAIPAPGGGVAPPEGPSGRIAMVPREVPLNEALKYVATLANCTLRWDENAVVIAEVGKDGKPLAKREIRFEQAESREVILKKMEAIVFPKLEFKKATLREAFEFISQRMRTLDPDGAGLNTALRLDGDGGRTMQRKLTFSVTNLSLKDLLCYLAEICDMDVRVSERVVYLVAKSQK